MRGNTVTIYSTSDYTTYIFFSSAGQHTYVSTAHWAKCDLPFFASPCYLPLCYDFRWTNLFFHLHFPAIQLYEALYSVQDGEPVVWQLLNGIPQQIQLRQHVQILDVLDLCDVNYLQTAHIIHINPYETPAYGYSFERTQRELSNEYQHDIV